MGVVDYGSSQIHDTDRDLYQMRRHLDEAYIRQQYMYAQQSQALFGQRNSAQQGQLVSQESKPDPKDPLAFLNKPHKTLLLTGEAL